MRWPAQSGVNRSTARTPVGSGVFTRGRVGVERDAVGAFGQGAEPVDGATERVDHTAFPARVRTQLRRADAMGEATDTGLDPALERLHGGAGRVDAQPRVDLVADAGTDKVLVRNLILYDGVVVRLGRVRNVLGDALAQVERAIAAIHAQIPSTGKHLRFGQRRRHGERQVGGLCKAGHPDAREEREGARQCGNSGAAAH